MPVIPLATRSAPGDYAGGRLINYFYVPTEGPGQGACLQRSPLERRAVLALGESVRAITQLGNVVYAACGGFLWSYDNGTVTKLGPIPDGQTTIATRQGYVVLTAGGRYYVHDTEANTLFQVDTSQVQVAVSVATFSGYTVVVGSDATRTDRIAVSNLDDPTTFPGLGFGTAEVIPDKITGVFRDHLFLRVFGGDTTETYTVGTGSFPLTRQDGAHIEEGAIAGTMAQADNAVFWVDTNRLFRRVFGASPEIVSPGELSEFLKGKSILGGFAFKDRGRDFYAVRVENEPTWVLSIFSGRVQEYTSGADHGPWIATCATEIDGVTYLGTENGTICTFGGSDDDGEIMRREIQSLPITEDRINLSRVEVSVETGTQELGRDRKINLEISRNGKTWTRPIERELGDLGEYRRAARWNNLGTYEDFTQLKVWITDPVQADIYGLLRSQGTATIG